MKMACNKIQSWSKISKTKQLIYSLYVIQLALNKAWSRYNSKLDAEKAMINHVIGECGFMS